MLRGLSAVKSNPYAVIPARTHTLTFIAKRYVTTSSGGTMDLSLTATRNLNQFEKLCQFLYGTSQQKVTHQLWIADFLKGKSSCELVYEIEKMAKRFEIPIQPQVIMAVGNYDSLDEIQYSLDKLIDTNVERVLLTGGSRQRPSKKFFGDATQAVRNSGFLVGNTISPLWYNSSEISTFIEERSPDFLVTELTLDMGMLSKIMVSAKDIETTVALPFEGNGTFVFRNKSGLTNALTGKEITWLGDDSGTPIEFDGDTLVTPSSDRNLILPHNVCEVSSDLMGDDGVLDMSALQRRIPSFEGEVSRAGLRTWLRINNQGYVPTLKQLALLGRV